MRTVTPLPPGAERPHPATAPRLDVSAGRLGEVHDPIAALDGDPSPVMLVVDGRNRRNVAAAGELAAGLPVVGVVGHLTRASSDRIAAACPGTVYLWLQRGWRSDVELRRAHADLTRLLHNSGVEDVLIVPNEDDEDPASLLGRFGAKRAARRVDALLRSAEWAGAYSPDNRYDTRNGWRAA